MNNDTLAKETRSWETRDVLVEIAVDLEDERETTALTAAAMVIEENEEGRVQREMEDIVWVKKDICELDGGNLKANGNGRCEDKKFVLSFYTLRYFWIFCGHNRYFYVLNSSWIKNDFLK